MQEIVAKPAPASRAAGAGPFGTIYGVVLNDHRSLEKMGVALDAAPYKGRPRAPVLYIKPRNTHSTSKTLSLPREATSAEIGATLGIVIGREAARVDASRANDFIQGYVTVADISLPHESYYRPAIREKCFDGSCLMTPEITAANSVVALEQLVVRTSINGKEADAWPLSALVLSVPQLIAEVTDFMTLQQGDVLLVGVQWNAPQAVAGDSVEVEIKGVGMLRFGVESFNGGSAQ